MATTHHGIVTRHWRQIEALASELLLHRRLGAAQIMAIIERSAPQRVVYGFERRDGRDVPTQNPDPRRMTSVTVRRVDGYIVSRLAPSVSQHLPFFRRPS